ncbi:hypothetical protein EXS73_02580 [Candidatus Pacearchaeota archaeon]|nr:hypothetical protein [Candidatus Pacearchaeota archaeon]
MKVMVLCALSFFLCSFPFVSADTLEAHNLLLKISTYQEESFNRTVTFSSTSGGSFTVTLQGITNGVTLPVDSFMLEPGQSKPLTLSFDTSSLKPGVVVGLLLVRGKTAVASVPLVLEIETKDVFFDANLDIPPQYTEVHPGEKVVAQIKVFDLTSGGGTSQGLGPTNVLLHYAIVDSTGKQISAESETVSVDTTTQITQALGFPDTMPPGDYVFYVTATYKSSVGSSSHLFKIIASEKGLAALTSGDSQTYVIVGVFVIFFLGMVFFFIYLLRDRDSLILELHKLNASDYHRQRSFIQAQARVLVHKKGKSLAPLVKHELARVKQTHHQRVIQLKALKQKGDVQAMKRQLAHWKADYSAGKGLATLHGLSGNEMKATLARWKKKYTH